MDTPPLAHSSAAAVAAPDPYVAALDAASESLGKAISSCLEGKGVWRFAEVQRLCKIGQAIMRVRTRADPSVGGYVDPVQQRGPNGCMMGNGVLGGVDPFGDDGLGFDAPAQGLGMYPMPGLAMNNAGPLFPNQRMQNPARPAVGGVDGAMEMLRGTLSTIEANDNKRSQLDMLHELRNLGELLEGQLSDHEREVLQARRTEIVATIAAQTELDRRAREGKTHVQTPANVPHLRCDACGTAHDGDWVTPDGRIRACDVCGGPMRWSDLPATRPALPPALDSEAKQDPQPEPQENKPCPPSSPRTSGTSRRRTATSASKRSTSARRS